MDSKHRKIWTKYRKIWTQEETMSLVELYRDRIEDFQHVRKKKYAYARILKDLKSRGKIGSETTVAMVEAKIYTLYKTYKAAKKNGKKTDKIPFMNEMKEIFENRFIHAENLINEDKVPTAVSLQTDKEKCIVPFTNEMEKIFDNSNNHIVNVPTADVKCDPELSIFNFQEDFTTTSTGEKLDEPKLTKQLYWSKMLELKEKDIENRRIERLELFKIKEENKAKRHREKIYFFKLREQNASKRHKDAMKFLNKIFP